MSFNMYQCNQVLIPVRPSNTSDFDCGRICEVCALLKVALLKVHYLRYLRCEGICEVSLHVMHSHERRLPGSICDDEFEACSELLLSVMLAKRRL
jgi:hypothetical protein